MLIFIIRLWIYWWPLLHINFFFYYCHNINLVARLKGENQKKNTNLFLYKNICKERLSKTLKWTNDLNFPNQTPAISHTYQWIRPEAFKFYTIQGENNKKITKKKTNKSRGGKNVQVYVIDGQNYVWPIFYICMNYQQTRP